MTRETMWANIGTEASVNDFDVLLREADLDYTVSKKDLKVEHNGKELIIPDRKIIMRDGTDQSFGIVSDRYQVCQNRDALDFVKYIDGITLLKAGQLYNGLVYMIAQLPEVEVLGDKIAPHLIFQNSHDGTSSIKTTITMLRLVCQNQFTRSFKESPATISISHLGDLDEKLIVARDTMSKAYQHIQSFNDEANELVGKKITPARLNKVMSKFFYTSPEFSDKKNQRIEQDREKFMEAFRADDNANFTRTMWGLVNAFADFTTHQEPARKTANWEESRFAWYLSPYVMDQFVEFCKAA